MAHPRKTIRAAVKQRIKTGDTLAQDRVFSTMMPISSIEQVLDEEGPMVMAYVRSESKPDYQNGRVDASAKHTIELVIEGLCVARKSQSADDLVDDLAEQIEALMDGLVVPEYPSGQFVLVETQIDVTDTLQNILGGVSLTYEFEYYVVSSGDVTTGVVPIQDVLPGEALTDGTPGIGAGTPGLHGVEVV